VRTNVAGQKGPTAGVEQEASRSVTASAHAVAVAWSRVFHHNGVHNIGTNWQVSPVPRNKAGRASQPRNTTATTARDGPFTDLGRQAVALGGEVAAQALTSRTTAKIRRGLETARQGAGEGIQGGRTRTEEGNSGDADLVDDVNGSVVFTLSSIDGHVELAVVTPIISGVVLVVDMIISGVVLVVAVVFALVLQGQVVGGDGGHKHGDIRSKGDRVRQHAVRVPALGTTVALSDSVVEAGAGGDALLVELAVLRIQRPCTVPRRGAVAAPRATVAGGIGSGEAFENGGQQTNKVDRSIGRGLKDGRPLLSLLSRVHSVLDVGRFEHFFDRVRHGLPEKGHGGVVLRVPVGEQINKVKREILVQR